MKLSTIPGDPGYQHDARAYSVTLDGTPVRRCDLIAADDTTGIVCTHKRRSNGDLVMLNGDTVTVIQHGEVTIEKLEFFPEEVNGEVPFQ